jgi:AAA domain
MRLTHLAAVGSELPRAAVEFGPGLTVIYGASDSGKSYIAEAIDYVFGASKLKQIPESEGYSHLLLGLVFPDGQVVTLVRPMPGNPGQNRIAVYAGQHMNVPTWPPDVRLASKHSPSTRRTYPAICLHSSGSTGGWYDATRETIVGC